MNFKELGDHLGLEEDEYLELVELFMSTGVADFQNLKAALATGDQDSVVHRAHTIKGAAGNLGLTDIFKTAGLMEQQAAQGHLTQVTPMIETLQAQFDAIEALMGK